MRRVAALTVALLLAASTPGAANAQARFAFGVFGDTPYLPGEELVVATMIDQMNGKPWFPSCRVKSSGSPTRRASHVPKIAPMNPRTIDTRHPPWEYPTMD